MERVWLKNDKGMKVSLITLGATVTHLLVPLPDGETVDVILGFEKLEDFSDNSPYFGCIVGRVANRIAEGKFTLPHNGTMKEYTLCCNNPPNHLHGGPAGFHSKIWKVIAKKCYFENEEKKHEGKEESASGECECYESVTFEYVSPHMEEGYPGTLTAQVTYTLPRNENALQIDYSAHTDSLTLCNLTNHMYFNLNFLPDASLPSSSLSSIANHELTLFSDSYLPVDANLIPTAERRSVCDSIFDFNFPRSLSVLWDVENDHYACRVSEADVEQVRIAQGYDHTFVLKNADIPRARENDEAKSEIEGASMEKAAILYSPDSKIQMEVWTDQPGVQLYTGNFLNIPKGKYNFSYPRRSALCLETQGFPNAVNTPSFPSVQLSPHQLYRTSTIYSFSVQN